MKQLPNNRRMGKVSITPPDWETCDKSALKKEWVIRYRFYDDNTKEVKPVWISSFNHGIDTLTERRKQLRDSLAFEIDRLENYGWNPISGDYDKPLNKKASENEISKYMSFESALKFADTKIKVSEETRKQETDNLLKQLLAEAKKQGVAKKQMHEVTRKHLREIIEKCAINKLTSKYSKDKYNRCRKVLGYYYKELLDYEVVEANIPMSLNKEKGQTKKVEAEISPEMQKKVSEYLKNNHYRFWLYAQVFFNTAPRSSEMLRLKVSDVDLKNQRIKFLIKKGQQYSEKYRIIPDIVIPMWVEIIGDAPKDFYVFGEGLRPSRKQIKSYQIHKRWRRLVTQKDEFENIGITFYQLKHLRLTDISDMHGVVKAAELAGESVAMVNKHYDLNASRGDESLRKSGKLF